MTSLDWPCCKLSYDVTSWVTSGGMVMYPNGQLVHGCCLPVSKYCSLCVLCDWGIGCHPFVSWSVDRNFLVACTTTFDEQRLLNQHSGKSPGSLDGYDLTLVLYVLIDVVIYYRPVFPFPPPTPIFHGIKTVLMYILVLITCYICLLNTCTSLCPYNVFICVHVCHSVYSVPGKRVWEL